jgi:hypothetical protein
MHFPLIIKAAAMKKKKCAAIRKRNVQMYLAEKVGYVRIYLTRGDYILRRRNMCR